MKIKCLAVFAAMAIAILGAIVPLRSANAGPDFAGYMRELSASPSNLCPDYNSTMSLTTFWGKFGGTDFCQYGVLEYAFPNDETIQYFVIGTDYSVWTKWQNEYLAGIVTTQSSWVDLGGTIVHKDPIDYDTANFFGTYCGDRYTLDIWVKGTDRNWWYDRRSANGRWSGWVKRNRAPACPSVGTTIAALSILPDTNDVTLETPVPLQASAVPEPSSIWMMLIALAGLIGYHWRSQLFPGRHSVPASPDGSHPASASASRCKARF